MKDILECLVVLRGQELTGDDMGVANVPDRMDCFVMIWVSVVDMGSRIAHATRHTTRSAVLTASAYRNSGNRHLNRMFLYPPDGTR